MLQFGEMSMDSLQKSLQTSFYAWSRVFIGRECGLNSELIAIDGFIGVVGA